MCASVESAQFMVEELKCDFLSSMGGVSCFAHLLGNWHRDALEWFLNCTAVQELEAGQGGAPFFDPARVVFQIFSAASHRISFSRNWVSNAVELFVVPNSPFRQRYRLAANAVDPQTGNTLLHVAAIYGGEASVVALVDHGAAIATTNHAGETPALYSLRHPFPPRLLHPERPESLRFLVQRLPRTELSPEILSLALQSHFKEIATYVLTYGSHDAIRAQILLWERRRWQAASNFTLICRARDIKMIEALLARRFNFTMEELSTGYPRPFSGLLQNFSPTIAERFLQASPRVTAGFLKIICTLGKPNFIRSCFATMDLSGLTRDQFVGQDAGAPLSQLIRRGLYAVAKEFLLVASEASDEVLKCILIGTVSFDLLATLKLSDDPLAVELRTRIKDLLLVHAPDHLSPSVPET